METFYQQRIADLEVQLARRNKRIVEQDQRIAGRERSSTIFKSMFRPGAPADMI